MPDNLYKRGNAWYYRFKLHGRDVPYRGSCFTHRLDEAKKVLRQKMAEAEATPGVATVATTRHASTAALEAFDVRRAKLVGSSERVIETTIRAFWRRLGAHFEHAGEVTADALSIYARTMIERGLTPQTIKRDLWAAKRAYEWAQMSDPSLPPLGKLPKLKPTPRGKKKGVAVPLDKVNAFLRAARGPARLHAIVILMTGLRLTEFRRVRPEWVVRKDDAWFLELPEGSTKNGKSRRIGLSLLLSKTIRRYAPFTVDYRTAWRTASKRVGLDKPMMARDLRHIFASTLAPHDGYGVDLVMGHAPGVDGSSTRFYQHADDARLHALALRTADCFVEGLAMLADDTLGYTGGFEGSPKVPNSGSYGAR